MTIEILFIFYLDGSFLVGNLGKNSSIYLKCDNEVCLQC